MKNVLMIGTNSGKLLLFDSLKRTFRMFSFNFPPDDNNNNNNGNNGNKKKIISLCWISRFNILVSFGDGNLRVFDPHKGRYFESVCRFPTPLVNIQCSVDYQFIAGFEYRSNHMYIGNLWFSSTSPQETTTTDNHDQSSSSSSSRTPDRSATGINLRLTIVQMIQSQPDDRLLHFEWNPRIADHMVILTTKSILLVHPREKGGAGLYKFLLLDFPIEILQTNSEQNSKDSTTNGDAVHKEENNQDRSFIRWIDPGDGSPLMLSALLNGQQIRFYKMTFCPFETRLCHITLQEQLSMRNTPSFCRIVDNFFPCTPCRSSPSSSSQLQEYVIVLERSESSDAVFYSGNWVNCNKKDFRFVRTIEPSSVLPYLLYH